MLTCSKWIHYFAQRGWDFSCWMSCTSNHVFMCRWRCSTHSFRLTCKGDDLCLRVPNSACSASSLLILSPMSLDRDTLVLLVERQLDVLSQNSPPQHFTVHRKAWFTFCQLKYICLFILLSFNMSADHSRKYRVFLCCTYIFVITVLSVNQRYPL